MGQFLASEDAFVRLYRAEAPRLLTFFARRTLDAQVAVDLVAETFAEALVSRKRFRGSGDAEAAAWLFAIGRRLLAQYFEAGAVRHKLSQRLIGGVPDLDDDDYARIDELASLARLRDVLREELLKLDSGQRDALWLRVVEERPFHVVAERLGITEGAARKRVSRALKALAEQCRGLQENSEKVVPDDA